MKWTVLGLLAVGLMTGPIAARATPLLGIWEGPITGPGATNGEEATWDFVDPPPGATYNVAGTLSVICTLPHTDPMCGTGGLPVPITGEFGPGDLLSLMVGATFTGSVMGDSFTVSGIDADGLFIQGVANRVPEPATLSLLSLGLAGVGFMRRLKLS